MSRSGSLVTAALLGALLPWTAPPAAAQELPVQQAEVLRLCGTVSADATTGDTETVDGFASSSGQGCSPVIRTFRGVGTAWSSAATPYRGRVLAAAQDESGTYVLYQAADGVRLGKRTTAGAFGPSRLLSPVTEDVDGDVAAYGGEWWAVWTEPVGEFGTHELFQARTWAPPVERQRVTSNGLPDLEPSLTLEPVVGATLAWTRNDAPVEPTSSDIWLGTSTGSAWSTRPVFTRGQYNSRPDLWSWGPTSVGFVRDGAPRYADDASGRYVVTAFPRPEGAEAVQPRVGSAIGRVFLGWIAVGEEFEPVVLATGSAGTWQQQQVTGVGPAGAGLQGLHAVVGIRSGAVVLHSTPGALRASTLRIDGCVVGAIRERYLALGGPGGFLGRALTCEQPTPYRVGAFTHFEGGSIYWSPGTGAWEVHGSIRETWARLGWENSAVGFPLTDETRTPNRPGAFNHFEWGSIYWSPTTGAHEVRGAIRDRWARMGWEDSILGFPLTDESRTPHRPGAFNHFERGSIYWSPGTGAHAVYGAIRERWASLGWEESALGFPVTSEYAVPGGRRSDFQFGSITWTPTGGTVVWPGAP